MLVIFSSPMDKSKPYSQQMFQSAVTARAPFSLSHISLTKKNKSDLAITRARFASVTFTNTIRKLAYEHFTNVRTEPNATVCYPTNENRVPQSIIALFIENIKIEVQYANGAIPITTGFCVFGEFDFLFRVPCLHEMFTYGTDYPVKEFL